mgnify:CR=1 FL=1
MKDLFSLKGEVAVVTGALGKLGPIWVETLLEAGAKVFALDHPDAKISQGYKSLQDRFDKQHLQLAFADVTAREALEAAYQECLHAVGVPSILVNNAGICPLTPPDEIAEVLDIPTEPDVATSANGRLVVRTEFLDTKRHPGKVIEFNKFSVNYNHCMFCGLCVETCPTEVLH